MKVVTRINSGPLTLIHRTTKAIYVNPFPSIILTSEKVFSAKVDEMLIISFLLNTVIKDPVIAIR